MLEEVGFVDVQETHFKVPIGLWPTTEKEYKIGQYSLANAQDGYEAGAIKFCVAGLGMALEEVKAMSAQVLQGVSDPAKCAAANW